jgi:hypothetical protein
MPNDKEQQLSDVEHSLVIFGDVDYPLLIYLWGHILEDSLLNIKEYLFAVSAGTGDNLQVKREYWKRYRDCKMYTMCLAEHRPSHRRVRWGVSLGTRKFSTSIHSQSWWT